MSKTPLNVFLESFPHHTQVLNSLSPKVFGCTVFAHKNQPIQSKLDPKTLKCIFVGYSPTQQGYKCYNPTRKFIVSYDVSLIENQPFFQNHSQQESISET